MCTIALAWRVLEDAPVAVAANRDEALERESLPPRLLVEDPEVLAPQDAEAGGTWIGVSERGLVVAITNRWLDEETVGPDFGGERSRGLLVRDVLQRADADDALAFVRESVAAYEYSGFNLLVADDERASYLEWDGQLHQRDLDPGVHVIVNPGIDEDDERAVRLRDALAVGGGGSEGAVDDAIDDDRTAAAWLYRAAALLGNHDFEVCVHRDGFGTRSSSLLRVGDDDRAAYAFADGPPCETDYRPVDAPASFLEGSF